MGSSACLDKRMIPVHPTYGPAAGAGFVTLRHIVSGVVFHPYPMRNQRHVWVSEDMRIEVEALGMEPCEYSCAVDYCALFHRFASLNDAMVAGVKEANTPKKFAAD